MLKTFMLGALGYPLIELAYRRRTHWTMAVTGGMCLVALRRVSMRHGHRKLAVRCAMGALWITAVEFCVGCVVNRKMNWGVWDYSKNRGNLLGQVCPMFTAMWFALCAPVMMVMGRAGAEPAAQSKPASRQTMA